jgi:hypothetical protein
MADKLPPLTDKLNAALLIEIHNNLIDLNEKIEEMRLKEIREKNTYRDTNRYDVNHTITNATPNDPNDFDSPVYDREQIFETLGMINAPRVEVVNDGTDNLYVLVSHSGNATFSHEGLIRPGDVKRYKDVYELRLRSPTKGLPYRVTEYDLDSSPSVVNIRPLTCDDMIDVCDRAARLVGIVYGNLNQLQQRAITNELLIQLTNAGIEIDPRDRNWDLNFATDQVNVSGSSVDISSPLYLNTVETVDFNNLAALQQIPGATTWSILGTNTVIPSSTFMLLSNLTNATRVSNFPPVAQQMQIVSTSVNDAAAGTGAQQVEIQYLTDPASPSLFTRFSETVTLNGIVPVNTVSTGISRIEHMRVSRTGANGVAQGDISLQSVGGATTFELIPAGENINKTAVHFVPNGYMSIVTDIMVGTTTAAGVRFSFTDTPEDATGNVVRNGLEEISLSGSGVTKALKTPYFMTNPNNKRKSFAIAVRGQAANQQGSGSFLAIDIPL